MGYFQGAIVPLQPFPKQAELLLWLQEREKLKENGIIEKSRETGGTMFCAGYALHGWLFREGFRAGFGSRKLELVDSKGDLKTIFEKIRFMRRRLPWWMLPEGFSEKGHDNQCRMLNPTTGGAITGEGGDEIGRGDRTHIYFVDEAASLEHPELAEASLFQATRCRIDISTPKGPGNPFARKRFSGTVPVFTLHWKDDPRKGEEWYKDQCRKMGDPVLIAQELDIDYTASIEGICIPASWVRAAVGLQLPESGELVAGLDVADEGKAKTVLTPRRGPVVKMPIAWGQTNTTESAWRARDEAEKLGAKVVNYDTIGVGAGVKGTWDTSETPLKFQANAVNVGEAPTETVWPDEKTSKEKFINLRAEAWWTLRVRFEKTYEYVEKQVQHPLEDLISLPDCPPLIADLSLPLVERTETGKIQLESKKKMAARGIKSPDYGDSLALAFLPETPKKEMKFW